MRKGKGFHLFRFGEEFIVAEGMEVLVGFHASGKNRDFYN